MKSDQDGARRPMRPRWLALVLLLLGARARESSGLSLSDEDLQRATAALRRVTGLKYGQWGSDPPTAEALDELWPDFFALQTFMEHGAFEEVLSQLPPGIQENFDTKTSIWRAS